MEPSQVEKSSPTIPIAIIIGFGMIALAIFFTGGTEPAAPAPVANTENAEAVATEGPRPVDETDYILGNPNAPILLIEYSDYDCPFCKQFHSTMNRIMDEYGVNGQVAWVYRQFPIEQLHPNSPRISEAALCVGDIGGSSAFWQFSNLVFEQREADAPTNVLRLPEYAERVGIDRSQYTACMDSRRMQPAVLASVEDGFNAGVRGTPHTFVVAGNQQAVINGSRSFDTVSAIVENLLNQLEGTFTPETMIIPEGASVVPDA